ncbi:type 1 fimbrial protein [Serratia fonticola]|uniref:fimbrial protein n=1 Tax=Serratia fonticola TaxID=47917 RepID=UPI0015C58838|nr:fimbrial protein [Serratia fonticola]MBC3382244.1 type 1 fimbrial protein [Serratia fonticola]NYA41443.1 type 1 fimbrial protein [Serratia fonticola]
MNRKTYFGLLGGLVLLFSNAAQALIQCRPGPTPSHTVPVTPGTLSVGPDMPVGSIIYRGSLGQGIVNSKSGYIRCANTPPPNVPGEAFSHTTSWDMSNTPLPLSSWNGYPHAGKVYETGIPGVGFVAWVSHPNFSFTNVAPYRAKYTATMPSDGVGWQIAAYPMDFYLIKIGNIPAGSFTLNAAQFPTLRISMQGDASDNVVPFDIPVSYFNFSGTLQFTQPSCVTPDVTVELGSHEVATFAAAGSTTPWQSFNIQLTHCPRFNGYYNRDTYPVLFNAAGSTNTPDTVNNNFGLKLTPTSSVINDMNGIMAVTPGSNAASGVGIQIAYGTASSPVPFVFSAEKKLALAKNGESTVTVPMLARYIKTSTTVSPGRADGKVTFTINYY